MKQRTYFAVREHSIQILGTESHRILMAKRSILTVSRYDLAEEIAGICNKSVKLRLGEFAKFYSVAGIPKSVPAKVVRTIPEYFSNLNYD